jgi:hypothetical protein
MLGLDGAHLLIEAGFGTNSQRRCVRQFRARRQLGARRHEQKGERETLTREIAHGVLRKCRLVSAFLHKDHLGRYPGARSRIMTFDPCLGILLHELLATLTGRSSQSA